MTNRDLLFFILGMFGVFAAMALTKPFLYLVFFIILPLFHE